MSIRFSRRLSVRELTALPKAWQNAAKPDELIFRAYEVDLDTFLQAKLNGGLYQANGSRLYIAQPSLLGKLVRG